MPHSGSPSRKKRSRDKSKERRRHRRSRSRSVGSRSSKHSRRYYKKRSRSRTPSYHRSKYSSSGKHASSRSASSSYKSVTPDHRSSKRSSHERRRRRSSSSSSSSSAATSSTTSSYSEHSSSSVCEVKPSRDKHKKSTRIPTPPPPPITHNFTSIDLLDEPATQETIDLINEDEFVPKSFSSSKNITDKVVIDLKTQTITVPTAVNLSETPDDSQTSLFHPNLFGDDTVRMEKWIKKLYNYRQKLFFGST